MQGATMPKHPSFNLSQNDNWETPVDVLNYALDYFDFEPTLDVCATAFNKKCHMFIKENSLQMRWQRNFFMNCPYSKAADWIYHAYDQQLRYNISGLALLFVKSDTKVWRECILDGKAEILFITGRVKFLKNGIPSKNTAPYPSCFVFWRAK